MCITSLNNHLAPAVVWKEGKKELLNFLFFTKCLITVILEYIGQRKIHAGIPHTQSIETQLIRKSWINYSKLFTLMLSFKPFFHQKGRSSKGIEHLLWNCMEMRYILQWKKKWNSLCVRGENKLKNFNSVFLEIAFFAFAFSVFDQSILFSTIKFGVGI